MKRIAILVGSLLIVGCKNQEPPATAMHPVEPINASTALVFDPPILRTGPALDLDRNNHGQAALVGFEEPVTTFSDVFTLNREATDGSDRIVKQAVTERIGVTHR